MSISSKRNGEETLQIIIYKEFVLKKCIWIRHTKFFEERDGKKQKQNWIKKEIYNKENMKVETKDESKNFNGRNKKQKKDQKPASKSLLILKDSKIPQNNMEDWIHNAGIRNRSNNNDNEPTLPCAYEHTRLNIKIPFQAKIV